MHASQCPAARQQQGVRRHASRADAPAMFNLLTGPQLLRNSGCGIPGTVYLIREKRSDPILSTILPRKGIGHLFRAAA